MKRVARKEWSQYEHIEYDPECRLWVTLRGVGTSETPAEQQVLGFECGDLDSDEWLPWTPPEDVERIAADWPTWGSPAR